MLAAQIISLVTSVAFARILGPEKLGVLAIVTQLSQAIIPLSSLGIGIALVRMIPEYRRKGREATQDLIASTFTMTILAGATVTLVYFLLADYLAVVYGRPDMVVYVQITSVLVVMDALVALGAAVVQGFERVRELAVISLIARAISVPITIGFVLRLDLLGAVLSSAVSQVFSFAIYLWAIRSIFRTNGLTPALGRLHRPTAAAVLRTALPLFGAFIILRPALLFQASFLALFLGFSELGLFRVASGLYRIALILPASLSVPLLPAISDMYAGGTREQTRAQLSSLLRITSFLALPITLLVGLGAVPIVQTLYGPEYVAAARLIFVISAAAFGDTLAAVVENTLLGTGRTKLVFLLTAMQAITIAAGSYLFLSAFGLIGIGFAMLLNSAVYAVVVGVYLLRRQEIRFRDFRSILTLATLAYTGAAVLVYVGSLRDVVVSAAYLGGILLVEWRILSKKDRFVLKDAMKSMLGRE